MSFLGGGSKAAPPPPPPPPPAAPQVSAVQAQGMAETASLASAAGGGLNGTDLTGGQGAANPRTTKTALGGG